MYKQIKKIPRYLIKLVRDGNPKEMFHIIKNVRFEHIFIALAARLDRKATCVKFKEEPFEREINYYMEMLSHRRKKQREDIYLWDFNGKQISCNYMQLQGLIDEYLNGLFEDIYAYDWQNKNVVDIGGFVGDTAHFFLSKGAKKVVIYEPVAKNLQALRYNLKDHEGHIECYQEALAEKNALITLSSDQTEGSSGFGKVAGNYQLECQGATITTILNRHHPIDVIKVDCEGAEEYLLGMTEEEIRSIPFWIIETHSQELYQNIMKKFQDHRFSNIYNKALTSSVNLLHFKVMKEDLLESIDAL